MLGMNKIALIFYAIFLCSCLSIKDPMAEVQPLNSSNFSILDGAYKCAVDTITCFTLADNLISNYQVKYGRFEYNDSVICKLNLIDLKTLKVQIIRNGIVEIEKLLKGEIKDNYFYLKSQTYRESYFGFVLKLIEKQKGRIGVMKDNNLVIDNRTLYTSSMFFIRGRHIYEDNPRNIYKRVK